jgi:hypothetical protein
LERTDPLTEIVAKKIIEYARSGARTPNRFRQLATAGLREEAPLDISSAKRNARGGGATGAIVAI